MNTRRSIIVCNILDRKLVYLIENDITVEQDNFYMTVLVYHFFFALMLLFIHLIFLNI